MPNYDMHGVKYFPRHRKTRKPFDGLRVLSEVVLVLAFLLGLFVTGVQVGIWWARNDIAYRSGWSDPPLPPAD